MDRGAGIARKSLVSPVGSVGAERCPPDTSAPLFPCRASLGILLCKTGKSAPALHLLSKGVGVLGLPERKVVPSRDLGKGLAWERPMGIREGGGAKNSLE